MAKELAASKTKLKKQTAERFRLYHRPEPSPAVQLQQQQQGTEDYPNQFPKYPAALDPRLNIARLTIAQNLRDAKKKQSESSTGSVATRSFKTLLSNTTASDDEMKKTFSRVKSNIRDRIISGVYNPTELTMLNQALNYIEQLELRKGATDYNKNLLGLTNTINTTLQSGFKLNVDKLNEVVDGLQQAVVMAGSGGKNKIFQQLIVNMNGWAGYVNQPAAAAVAIQNAGQPVPANLWSGNKMNLMANWALLAAMNNDDLDDFLKEGLISMVRDSLKTFFEDPDDGNREAAQEQIENAYDVYLYDEDEHKDYIVELVNRLLDQKRAMLAWHGIVQPDAGYIDSINSDILFCKYVYQIVEQQNDPNFDNMVVDENQIRATLDDPILEHAVAGAAPLASYAQEIDDLIQNAGYAVPNDIVLRMRALGDTADEIMTDLPGSRWADPAAAAGNASIIERVREIFANAVRLNGNQEFDKKRANDAFKELGQTHDRLGDADYRWNGKNFNRYHRVESNQHYLDEYGAGLSRFGLKSTVAPIRVDQNEHLRLKYNRQRQQQGRSVADASASMAAMNMRGVSHTKPKSLGTASKHGVKVVEQRYEKPIIIKPAFGPAVTYHSAFDLRRRLTLLMSDVRAGNTSSGVREEGHQIATAMMQRGWLTKMGAQEIFKTLS